MIRKSATGVIVALAVIWGGGTWYTGTQIQPGVEKFIKDFNDAKKKGEHAYDMTLSYQNFDKGFFNSRFQMQMTFVITIKLMITRMTNTTIPIAKLPPTRK